MRQSTSEKARIRRLREKYRKRTVVVGIILFIIGLAVGLFVGSRYLNNRTDLGPVVTPAQPAVTPTAAIEKSVPKSEARDEEEDFGFEDVEGLDEEDFDAEDSGAEENAFAGDSEDAGNAGEEEDASTIALEATPTPTATPEPTPEPTATPEPTPVVLAVVPFGESYTYTTEIKADGTVRTEADADAYETVSFTQTMKSYMLPADFAAAYGTVYKLKGNEAGAEFELTLNNYTGTTNIVPQNTMVFAFESESGETRELGYQLMNAYVGGDYGVSVPTNTPKLLYKRYQYSNTGEPMKYLVVSTFEGGVEKFIKFELEGAAPLATDVPKTYDSLKKGDKSEAVAELQTKLIELGYLEGSADGDFGSKTETAIKLAQGVFGLEETGVADNEFQQKLFAAQPASAETPAPETAN